MSYHPKVKAADRPKVKGIDDVYQLFLQNWNKDRIELIEEFKMILLDSKNAVLGISHISTAGFSGVLADPKVVFAIAFIKKSMSPIEISNSTEDIGFNPLISFQNSILSPLPHKVPV